MHVIELHMSYYEATVEISGTNYSSLFNLIIDPNVLTAYII